MLIFPLIISKKIFFYIKMIFYVIVIHTLGDNASFYVAMTHLRSVLEQDLTDLKGRNK